MRRDDAAALALLLLCAAGLSFHLGSVPALTLDEAWVGLFARRLLAEGAFTPHQMNHYTGPLFSWAVSTELAARGFSVASLRLFGACANALAWVGLWIHLRRRASSQAALTWALLLAGSPFLLVKSRLAWEVYALQPALVAVSLSALARPGGLSAAVLCAAAVLGTQNHFIFLSVPASLTVLFGARAAWLGEKEARPLLSMSAAALAAGVVFALIKSPISDASWLAHRGPWLAAMIFGPGLAALAVWNAPEDWLVLPVERLRPALLPACGLTVLAFGIWHLVPMVQLLAGPVVYKRVFALALPLPATAFLLAWGLFLAAVVGWNAVRAWHRPAGSTHERTLLLWPAAYAAVFIAFRHTSSLRYYSLSVCVAMAALAAGLPRLAKADKRWAYAAAAAVALFTQGMLWREYAAPGDRAPQFFKVGWRKESSLDFSRKDALFAAFDASRACQVAHAERSFVAVPLQFHTLGRAFECDPALAFDADQAPERAAPPYYRWDIVPAAK